jgi:EmrB/QacA subfamily drug resistance transporter
MNGRYVALAIVMVGVFMSVLDAVALNIALPAITSDFGVAVADAQWVVTAYLLTQTCFLIIAGKVSERTGQARMFTAGLAAFTVASLLCALSANLEQLVLFRVVQGIGASMLFSVSTSIVFRSFDVRDRGRAMGFLGSTVAVGGMLGPVIGGFLVGTVGWQSIFLINVPIGAVAAIVAVKVLRIDEILVDRLHMDYRGAVLWVVSMASLMLTLGWVGQSGAVTPEIVIGLAAFVAAIVLFVRQERKVQHPLMDISVFGVKRFTLVGASMVMFFLSFSMVTILGPFYYEGVLNYEATIVGLIFMVLPAVTMFGSPLVGRMYDARRFRPYASAGHIVRAGGFFIMAYGFLTVNVLLTVAAFFLMGVGSCLFQTPNNSEMMLALPREKSGLASSIQATTRNLSMAMGISTATILMTLMMGSMDYGAIAGGPLADELARSVAIAVSFGGVLSIVGAAISRSSEERVLKEEGNEDR